MLKKKKKRNRQKQYQGTIEWGGLKMDHYCAYNHKSSASNDSLPHDIRLTAGQIATLSNWTQKHDQRTVYDKMDYRMQRQMQTRNQQPCDNDVNDNGSGSTDNTQNGGDAPDESNENPFSNWKEPTQYDRSGHGRGGRSGRGGNNNRPSGSGPGGKVLEHDIDKTQYFTIEMDFQKKVNMQDAPILHRTFIEKLLKVVPTAYLIPSNTATTPKPANITSEQQYPANSLIHKPFFSSYVSEKNKWIIKHALHSRTHLYDIKGQLMPFLREKTSVCSDQL